eukprot:scaffold1378_cov257-Pinguiococcus_pyrenoidosus.AAC.15
MVALVTLPLLSGLEVEHAHPQIRPAGDEAIPRGMQRRPALVAEVDAGHRVRPDQRKRPVVKERHLVSRRDREHRQRVRRLHVLHGAVEIHDGDALVAAAVELAERAVVGAS